MILRGPSTEARSRLEDRLLEVLGEVGSRKTAQVGEELLALGDLIRREPRLRRAFTDVSAEAEAKAQLARSLFDGKVDELSVDLLGTAVRQRWTATADLADSLEDVGVESLVRSADNAGRVADELFSVERLLVEEHGLRNALADPSRSTADKQQLLRSLLENRVLSATARLVEQAVGSGHRTVSLALAEYQKIAARVDKGRVATVRSARPLAESEQRRLADALRTQYSSAVHLNLVVDPDLVGGMRVEIGDDVIDGSVSARLDDAKRALVG